MLRGVNFLPTRCLCSDVAAGGGGGGANSSHAVERDAVIGLYFAFRICNVSLLIYFSMNVS